MGVSGRQPSTDFVPIQTVTIRFAADLVVGGRENATGGASAKNVSNLDTFLHRFSFE